MFSNVRDLSDKQVDDVRHVVSRLPNIKVKAEIDSKKTYLIPDTTYKVSVALNRITPRDGKRKPHDGRIHSPRFPKPQYESWWLVLGDKNKNELLGLKRVSMRNGPNETLGNKINTSISFDTPEHLGKHSYTLYLVSDGYLGLDQKFDINFETRMDLDS